MRVRALAAWVVLHRLLFGNDYLLGMALWAVVSQLGDRISQLGSDLHSGALRMITTNIRLGEQETKELMEYLRHHPSASNSAMLSLTTHSDLESDITGSRVFEYEPELNTAIRICHKSSKTGRRRWVWIANYTYSASATQPDPVVSTTVTVLGSDKSPVEEMIQQGRELLRNRRRKFLHIVSTYNYKEDNYGLGWNHGYSTDKKPPGRSIHSVILPRSADGNRDEAAALLEDAREFLESELWYTERGIPYRRGYLLHGLPGGGKSSLVAAVASELKLPIYVLQISNELLTDDSLHRLFQTMTLTPSILLLEDIDAADGLVHRRRSSVSRSKDSLPLPPVAHSTPEQSHSSTGEETEAKQSGPSPPISDPNMMMLSLMKQQHEHQLKESAEKKKRDRKLTLSGLLNALDGPTATTGRLLFMTTNHRGKLDPALVRSGRIDYEIEFLPVDKWQTQRLFARFYQSFRSDEEDLSKRGTVDASDDADASLSAIFAERAIASGVPLSAADVQGHLMRHKGDPQSAVDNFDEMIHRARRKTQQGQEEDQEGKLEASS